jgi:hypothetical protein
MDVKDKYDDGHGHYKCPDCGWWSTHPMPNHNCFKFPLPKKIIRLDDGMEFVLDEKLGTYHTHLGIPRLDEGDHHRHEYKFEVLMFDPRNKGLFKIADGTEDINAMKDDWKKRMDILTKNDGHGDSDDI